VAGIADYLGLGYFPIEGKQVVGVRPKSENMGVVSSHCRRFLRYDMKSSC